MILLGSVVVVAMGVLLKGDGGWVIAEGVGRG
jgi:hypothetical protein